MKLTICATHNPRLADGIAHYILRLAQPLSQMCDLTVLSPSPAAFGGKLDVRAIPDWAASISGSIAWAASHLEQSLPVGCECILFPTPIAWPHPRAASVSIVHDLTPVVLRKTQTTKKKLAFWAQLQLLRFADRVVADSVCTLADLRNLHLLPRDSTDVVYAGPGITPSVDIDGFASDLRPFALYVGGHGLHKNLARLIAAVARLPSSVLPRIVITGWSNRTLLANTLRHASLHRVRDRVVVMPAGLSDERLSALYRNCAVFVYPSLYEGFGLPVLEAMAHGAPVACSGVSSLPEVGGNAVLYFDPTSIDEIASSIRDVITHPSLASALRERGVERSSRFTWTRTANQILAIAKRAAETKRSRRLRTSPSRHPQE